MSRTRGSARAGWQCDEFSPMKMSRTSRLSDRICGECGDNLTHHPTPLSVPPYALVRGEWFLTLEQDPDEDPYTVVRVDVTVDASGECDVMVKVDPAGAAGPSKVLSFYPGEFVTLVSHDDRLGNL